MCPVWTWHANVNDDDGIPRRWPRRTSRSWCLVMILMMMGTITVKVVFSPPHNDPKDRKRAVQFKWRRNTTTKNSHYNHLCIAICWMMRSNGKTVHVENVYFAFLFFCLWGGVLLKGFLNFCQIWQHWFGLFLIQNAAAWSVCGWSKLAKENEEEIKRIHALKLI